MSVHLLRPAVGIEDIDHFHEVIEARKQPGDPPSTYITTRNVPRRADELCDGGSVYWIIKGQIRARARVLRVERLEDDNGRAYCNIYLEAKLVLVEPHPRRAHQGWRYLKPEDAPPDLDAASAGDLSPEMASDLKDLGLL